MGSDGKEKGKGEEKNIEYYGTFQFDHLEL